MEKIIFTRHAEFKRKLLQEHGFQITRQEIIDAIREPNRVRAGYHGRKVVEKKLTVRHLLRIVVEDSPEGLKIVTLYPTRRDRYET